MALSFLLMICLVIRLLMLTGRCAVIPFKQLQQLLISHLLSAKLNTSFTFPKNSCLNFDLLCLNCQLCTYMKLHGRHFVVQCQSHSHINTRVYCEFCHKYISILLEIISVSKLYILYLFGYGCDRFLGGAS